MKRPAGFKGFSIMSIGQIISLVGSSMTQFGIGIWIWQTTGNATPFSIVATLFFIPNIIFIPIAGALIDRWPKKRSLILPDLAAGIITIITLILYKTNNLTLWFIYIASFISGSFNAFQWPAYSVTISIMLKKEEYGRANGLFSLTETAPMVVAPIVAGALLPIIKLGGIMTIDIITFVFAIGAVLWVVIPDIRKEVEEKVNLFKDAIFGFPYIFKRRPLFYLLLLFLFVNLFAGFYTTLIAPMILAKTNNNTVFLGTVESAFGIGGIVGGLLMTAWGGTKRKIFSLIFGIMLVGIGAIILGLSKTLVSYIVACSIIGVFGVITNSSNQAIWQSKVPPDLQGRVFSARRVIAQCVSILPMATSGPLVDNFLTPIFNNSSVIVLNKSINLTSIFGKGNGGAISLLSFLAGVMIVIISLLSFLFPVIMRVEEESYEKEIDEEDFITD